jgi:hypothetical protein
MAQEAPKTRIPWTLAVTLGLAAFAVLSVVQLVFGVVSESTAQKDRGQSQVKAGTIETLTDHDGLINVKYSFVVGAATYHGETTSTFQRRIWLAPGAPVTVTYDPQDPTVSTIAPEDASQQAYLGVIKGAGQLGLSISLFIAWAIGSLLWAKFRPEPIKRVHRRGSYY